VTPIKVISGGQTGVDRAALDAAGELGLPTGGWCPRGRRAEDGAIPDHYPLTELPSAAYGARTRKNIAAADATLILTPTSAPPTGGTALTARTAARTNKAHLIAALDNPIAADEIRAWLNKVRPAVLNVAGPRESESPGVHDAAFALLLEVLGQSKPDQ